MARFALVTALVCLVAAACDFRTGGSDETPTPPPSASASATVRVSPTRRAAAVTPQPTGVSSLRWRDCDEGFECASLDVPLDYDDPASRNVTISIVRLPAADPSAYIGPLFMNPGGPGSSSISFVRGAPFLLPRELLDRFDLIGVDTRGIGENRGIDCGGGDDITGLDFTPEDEAEIAGLEDYARGYSADCLSRNRSVLPFVDSISTARDLERVREAIGAQQISYLGYSYGTLLGAAYADLHPDRVRAMVLDGALPTGLTFEERVGDSALAFERVMDAFLDDCAARRACDFHSGGDPHAAYDALLERLEAEPIPALQYEDDVTTTADDVRGAVASALYDRYSWVQLAFALAIADRENDGSYILDLAYPYVDPDDDTTEGDANSAITCVDTAWPDNTDAFADLARELRAAAPRVGAGAVFYDLPCAFWGAESRPLPLFTAAGAPTILVIGTTGDAATPYEWSQALAEQLESSVLLTYDGFSHTASFGGISDCVDEAALLYLSDLVAPPSDTTCE